MFEVLLQGGLWTPVLSRDLPHDVQKCSEHGRLRVSLIGDGLLHMNRALEGSKSDIRPQPSNAGSAEGNAEIRAYQSQACDDAVGFVKRIEVDPGVPAHSRDCIMESRRDSPRKNNDAMILQRGQRYAPITTERMGFWHGKPQWLFPYRLQRQCRLLHGKVEKPHLESTLA